MSDTKQATETTLGAWTTGTSLPATVYASQAIVTQNRAYLLGGTINGTPSADVYTAPINPDGTLGAWTTAASLPDTLVYSQAIVTKTQVYLLGGHTGSGSSSATYTAPINPDGTLGAWTTGTSLPAVVHLSQAIVTKNRVYLLGGNINGWSSAATYTAPINPDGTLGAWTTAASLPDTLVYSQAIVTKTQVYLLGGNNSGGRSSDTYTAPINPDGTLGAWTTGASLPDTVYLSQAIVTKTQVHLLGGYDSGGNSATTYTAPINPDGTLGAWTTSTSLPAAVYHSQAIVTKNHVHLLGGLVKEELSSSVYVAALHSSDMALNTD